MNALKYFYLKQQRNESNFVRNFLKTAFMSMKKGNRKVQRAIYNWDLFFDTFTITKKALVVDDSPNTHKCFKMIIKWKCS